MTIPVLVGRLKPEVFIEYIIALKVIKHGRDKD